MALKPAATPPARQPWLVRHAAGVAACALGLVAVGVAAVLAFAGEDGDVTRIPNPWVTAPLLVVTLAAAITAFVRREGTYALPLIGIGLAAGAVVVGWTLVLAVIAGVTAVIILLLSEVM